jgi:hypothetical protein
MLSFSPTATVAKGSRGVNGKSPDPAPKLPGGDRRWTPPPIIQFLAWLVQAPDPMAKPDPGTAMIDTSAALELEYPKAGGAG